MNETNGLIKSGSSWHIFFQHNPTGNFWDDMSWGHSTSTDLIHWQYLPVALPVENNIQCFTGTSWSALHHNIKRAILLNIVVIRELPAVVHLPLKVQG